MTLEAFINTLKSQPDTISFADTMAVIEATYHFTPMAFSNGNTQNAADTNNGSCKIFAFGLLNGLSADQTLACFGDYYRVDVLGHPNGDDHQNIRNFMQSGWEGIQFEGNALQLK
jgi:hypothetical protein